MNPVRYVDGEDLKMWLMSFLTTKKLIRKIPSACETGSEDTKFI